MLYRNVSIFRTFTSDKSLSLTQADICVCVSILLQPGCKSLNHCHHLLPRYMSQKYLVLKITFSNIFHTYLLDSFKRHVPAAQQCCSGAPLQTRGAGELLARSTFRGLLLCSPSPLALLAAPVFRQIALDWSVPSPLALLLVNRSQSKAIHQLNTSRIRLTSEPELQVGFVKIQVGKILTVSVC